MTDLIPIVNPDGRLSAGVLPGAINVYPSPGRVWKLDDGFHPGGQGNNIFQLESVDTAHGPHLVGSVGKGSDIIDFTTGQQMDVFSALGPLPMLAPDSYGAHCTWTRPDGRRCLYLGGWVKRPAVVGPTNNHTNKYSWVAEFFIDDPLVPLKFNQWILLDKAQAANSWQSEVSQLIATPGGVVILRGDAQVGSSTTDLNHGTYFYDGTQSTTPYTITTAGGTITVSAKTVRLDPRMVVKGGIYADLLLLHANYSANVYAFDPLNGLASVPAKDFSYTAIPARAAGGTKTIDQVLKSQFSKLSGVLWTGGNDGYFMGDPRVASDCTFMPLLICPNGYVMTRSVGYRSNVVQVAGGIVTGINADLGGLRTDAALGFLVWIGPSGMVKIIDAGGAYGGIAVHSERLYFGRANLGHNDTYENLRGNDVELASIPIEAIHGSRPPAFTERLSHTSYDPATSGVNGLLGGYPTLGYTKGSLWLKAAVAGTLAVKAWTVSKGSTTALQSRTVSTITFTAGEEKYIDLATLPGALGGDILGWAYSAAGSLVGQISLQ